MAEADDLAGRQEAAQRREALARRLPRRRLGRATVALLVFLRVYVAVAVPLVGYAFVHALLAPR